MALGAQTAVAEVVRYDSKVTIDKGTTFGARVVHGSVESEISECERGRRVIVFKQRPGADRKLGTSRNRLRREVVAWVLRLPSWVSGSTVYAKVTRKAGDGFVCLADRSKNIVA